MQNLDLRQAMFSCNTSLFEQSNTLLKDMIKSDFVCAIDDDLRIYISIIHCRPLSASNRLVVFLKSNAVHCELKTVKTW